VQTLSSGCRISDRRTGCPLLRQAVRARGARIVLPTRRDRIPWGDLGTRSIVGTARADVWPLAPSLRDETLSKLESFWADRIRVGAVQGNVRHPEIAAIKCEADDGRRYHPIVPLVLAVGRARR
jgi:hypothetical protein